jgi:putative endonuclease
LESKKAIGNKAESIACDFLLNNGYSIIERNYHFGKNEIDIIAGKENLIIFVEVKSKSSDSMTNPEAAINSMKQQKIFKVANYYVMDKKISGADFRFDVIFVHYTDGGPKIEHFLNAFSYTYS